MSTQTALLNLKSKLETIPSGLDSPFQRNPSSTSIRSMSPGDAISRISPSPAKQPSNESNTSTPTTVATALDPSNNTPNSPSLSVSVFTLPADKKEEGGGSEGGRERGSFDQTRGNWGNRIVLTTYPGQANVGILYSIFTALLIYF